MSMGDMPIIGIDLGTTYTVCAYYDQQENTSKILPIEQPWNGWQKENFRQNDQLASTVFLHTDGTSTDAYVGHYCNEVRKYREQDDVYRLFKSIKRQIGTGWKTNFSDIIWTPSRISAIILKEIANSVQAYFGRPPEKVVITVPAAFSTEQRRETLAAAVLAGFDHGSVRLIDEPLAALLYYIWENMDEFFGLDKKYFAMLDIGGGTLDVSIIEVSISGEELIIDAIACSRYNEVAGDDFDLNIAGLLLEKMRDGHEYFDSLTEYERRNFAWRLLYEAETIKKEISISASQKSRIERKKTPSESHYRIDGLPKERHLVGTITLAELTNVLEPFFYLDKSDTRKKLFYPTVYKPIYEAFEVASKVLNMPNFGEDEIDLVFCTGGSSRLYHFQKAIGKFFGQPPRIIDPDFAVARGASLFYPIISNTVPDKVNLKVKLNSRLFDGIYIRSEHGNLIEIIPPNISIPSASDVKDIGLRMPRSDYRLAIEVFMGREHLDSLMICFPKQEIHFSDWIPEDTSIHVGYNITENSQVNLVFKANNQEGKLFIIDDYNLSFDNFRLPEINNR